MSKSNPRHTEDKAPRQKILAEIMHDYSTLVDGPGCFFVEDWIEMYPDTKFLPRQVVLGLSTSPQARLDSFNASIGSLWDGTHVLHGLLVPEMHLGLLVNNSCDQRTKAKYGVGVRTTEHYLFHNQHIRDIVPRERLLEFKAADG